MTTIAAPASRQTPWIELALLFCLAGLWGSSYFFAKVALADIPPITLVAIRVSGALLVLLIVIGVKGHAFPRDRGTWGALLIQALFNSIIAWTVLAWGQQHVESALASVLNSTSPIFVFLITFLFTRHEEVSLRRLLGALVGLLGVILIVGVDALAGLGTQVAAQVATVFGAMLYAIAAIYGKRFSGLPPAVTAAGTMLWATVVLVPASFMLEDPFRLTPSVPSLLAAAILAVFCTGVALLLYFRLIHTLGSLGVASQAYLRAGVGVALGMLILGETLAPIVALGIVAALVGVILINVPKRPRPPVSSGK